MGWKINSLATFIHFYTSSIIICTKWVANKKKCTFAIYYTCTFSILYFTHSKKPPIETTQTFFVKNQEALLWAFSQNLRNLVSFATSQWRWFLNIYKQLTLLFTISSIFSALFIHKWYVKKVSKIERFHAWEATKLIILLY